MHLKSIQLKNVRGFVDSNAIEFSKGLNILVGNNNSGKSTILRSIALIQPGETEFQDYLRKYYPKHVRLNTAACEVTVELFDIDESYWRGNKHNYDTLKDQMRIRYELRKDGQHKAVPQTSAPLVDFTIPYIQSREPNNFIYPYMSRRKPQQFQESVGLTYAQMVEETFTNLYAKIDRLIGQDLPESRVFQRVCREVLGFTVSCFPSQGGKQAGLVIRDGVNIAMENMGEGIINVLGLLVHLALYDNKLYLVEELENDIHPKALKKLLDFVIEKSEKNQFVISTHSHIVAKHLGSQKGTRLFHVSMSLGGQIPKSECKLVANDPQSRIQVLEDLGYDVFDLELYKGYLILEESTAERLIRDFFIPFLVPNLQGKLKTIAASGITDVEPRFVDFTRLFVFIHTAPQYRERAWVAVDSGAGGQKTIEDLKEKFKDWPPEHFRCFSSEHFESYYPPSFKSEAANVLAMPNGLEKQKAKGRLAERVLAWALEKPEEAETEFQHCAKEILEFLSEIGQKLS